MSFGKGGSQQPTQPQSVTTQTSNIPDWLQAPIMRNVSTAESIAQEPYQPYPDQRLATFNPDQSSSFQNVRDIFNAGNPTAVQGAQSIAQGTAARIPYHLQDQWNTANAQQYMNPYTDQVLNNVANRAQLGFNQQQQFRNSEAVKAGAFGGDRRFVVDQLAQDDLNRRLDEINASGLSQAYTTGMQGYNADRIARQQAEGLNLQSAQMLGGIGNLQQSLALQRANSLANIGAGERGLQQQSLDIGYTDFLNQRDYPRQNVNWLSSILRGNPYTAQSEVATYQQPPNPTNQILGAGIAGLGLANNAGWLNWGGTATSSGGSNV